MAEFSILARDRALRAMFGARTTVALLHGGKEETDANYSRQPSRIGTPQDGERVNATDVAFPAYRVDSASPVDGWALYDGDELIASGEMEPRFPMEGDQVVLRVGSIRVGLR